MKSSSFLPPSPSPCSVFAYSSQRSFMRNAIILSQWMEKASLNTRSLQMKQKVGLTLLELAR